MTQRVAVIGAGLAGLSCARVLRKAGCYVEVFERDRVIGGRLGTMRFGTTQFDHGCQYLTAKSDRFRAFTQEITASGYAARWEPRTAQAADGSSTLQSWIVGTPGMASVVRPLAESVRIHTGRSVHTIKRADKAWHLWFDDQSSAGPFAAVAIAVPPVGARLLLGDLDEISEPLAKVHLAPCWALMVKLEDAVLPGGDVFSDMSQVVRWIARNNSKPGRSQQGTTIVVHAAQQWSRETEEIEPEVVAEELWTEVCRVLDMPRVQPALLHAYLWRQGLTDTPLGETFVFQREHMIGVGGDWCRGRLAEQAFDSGAALGRAIVEALS